MAIDSSEILYDQDVVDPKPRGEMAPLNKLAVKSAKVAGKGAIGTAKLGGSGLLKFARWIGRNKRDLTMMGAAAATTASVILPEQAVNVSKHVVTGSVDAIHNPKGAVGSATTEAGQVLLDVADAAIAKASEVSSNPQVLIEPISEKQAEYSPSVDHAIDALYPGISDTDRDNLRIQMQVMRTYMLDNNLNEQSFNNVASWKDIIDGAVNGDAVDAANLRGLILAESSGDPTKVNEVSDAAGPVQMTKDVAIENDISPDDRYKPEVVLPVAAKILRGDEDYFGQKDFSVQAWHNGRTGTKTLIEGWTAEKGITFTDLKQVMKDNALNIYKMLQARFTREKMSDVDMDSSDLFVLKVAAGASLYEDWLASK